MEGASRRAHVGDTQKTRGTWRGARGMNLRNAAFLTCAASLPVPLPTLVSPPPPPPAIIFPPPWRVHSAQWGGLSLTSALPCPSCVQLSITQLSGKACSSLTSALPCLSCAQLRIAQLEALVAANNIKLATAQSDRWQINATVAVRHLLISSARKPVCDR